MRATRVGHLEATWKTMRWNVKEWGARTLVFSCSAEIIRSSFNAMSTARNRSPIISTWHFFWVDIPRFYIVRTTLNNEAGYWSTSTIGIAILHRTCIHAEMLCLECLMRSEVCWLTWILYGRRHGFIQIFWIGILNITALVWPTQRSYSPCSIHVRLHYGWTGDICPIFSRVVPWWKMCPPLVHRLPQ